MESNQLNDLLNRVREVESIIRNSDYVDRTSHQKLIDELHDIQKEVVQLDKNYAVDKTKNEQLFKMFNDLSKELEDFKKSIDTDNDSKKELGEKILLGLLSSIIAFVIGKFT